MPATYVDFQRQIRSLNGKLAEVNKELDDEAVKHFMEKRRMEQEIKDLKAERDQLKSQNDTLRKQAEKPARETIVRYQEDLQQMAKDKAEIERLRERNEELANIADVAEYNIDTVLPDVKKLVKMIDDAQKLSKHIDTGIASMEGRRED